MRTKCLSACATQTKAGRRRVFKPELVLSSYTVMIRQKINKDNLVWDGSVRTATGYELDGAVFEYRQGEDIFFSAPVQTLSRAHPVSCSIGTGVLFGGGGGGVKRPKYRVNHSYLGLRLRLTGAIPLFRLDAFKAWTGKTLLLK
jgi:hypothetical protein